MILKKEKFAMHRSKNPSNKLSKSVALNHPLAGKKQNIITMILLVSVRLSSMTISREGNASKMHARN
jgi:hypothetical protein